MPTGTILLYSGSVSTLTNQNNLWLFCNGSEVSRTTYHELFAVIGTTYGAGNGIDTFNLPDFRARFPLGSQGTNDTSLISGGNSLHTITIAELPAHDHDQGSLQIQSNGGHTHSYSDPGHNHGGVTGTGPFGTGSLAMVSSSGFGADSGTHTHSISAGTIGITIESNGNHIHSISGSTGSQGQGQPINMMPPYQIVHYIIRI
ncbi:unnamed protein product [Rotaria sp. Silwood1]|nr:unnamed protein product [Rotaria sp. Silwood1]CAF1596407.1 unnamed protein product [Rotaria sp. Silwood1]CAF3724429.1 unnamed protein product [Rotaria sp. Silwood1]CAF3818716.1 unnamed protein product [Rotaria sp. Silwood1]CAF3847778.1 unnamed protein product [Rotaria sp. Silwood1]